MKDQIVKKDRCTKGIKHPKRFYSNFLAILPYFDENQQELPVTHGISWMIYPFYLLKNPIKQNFAETIWKMSGGINLCTRHIIQNDLPKNICILHITPCQPTAGCKRI